MFKPIVNVVRALIGKPMAPAISAADDHPLDCWTPAERGIYSYWNGNRDGAQHVIVSADPLVIYRLLVDYPEINWDVDPKLVNSIKGDTEAYNRILNAVRVAFNVRPIDAGGCGLSESQCYDLLNHFLAYFDTLKKKAEYSPTSPMPTAQAS